MKTVAGLSVDQDPGPGAKYLVVCQQRMVPPPQINGFVFSYQDEAYNLMVRGNNKEDLDAEGYAFRILSTQTRVRYVVVLRSAARELGLVQDVNEFGEVTP